MIHYEINKEVLRDHWATLVNYDKTAVKLKSRSINYRRGVVVLTSLASIAAIITSFQPVGESMAWILVAVAIILPTIASGVLQVTTTFHGVTDWIKFRFIAETIRMHIYQYRTGTGAFINCDEENADDTLNAEIEKSMRSIKEAPNLDLLVKVSEAELDQAIADANRSSGGRDDADGMGAISFERYEVWRVKAQKNWYSNAIEKDRMREFRFILLIIFITSVGSIASGIAGLVFDPRLTVFVAVINIGIVAVDSWRNVGLIGKVRSLFLTTDEMLRLADTGFKALKNNKPYLENPLKYQKEFVNEIEALLDWERREWYKITLSAQVEASEAVYEQVAKLAQQNNPTPDEDTTTDNSDS